MTGMQKKEKKNEDRRQDMIEAERISKNITKEKAKGKKIEINYC